ncbi:MAG: hydroxylamine reductase [Victivallaceae bacterium]|nr:hydroxylamine reductase [Victivallaceae bacterium]MDD5663984.1 hydroxylamine reductase [Victivallaceae bacterium]
MSMFCYQCQETCRNTGCTIKGMCGKESSTANFMDVLIHALRGIAVASERSGKPVDNETGAFIAESLFVTITNANFSNERITAKIKEALAVRDRIMSQSPDKFQGELPEILKWRGETTEEYATKAEKVGVLSTGNEDVRSLRELLIYGLKGIGAYAEHACVLGFEKPEIYQFMVKALASTTKDLSVDEMVAIVMECGNTAVTTMALLDSANTGTYGNPEITSVKTGVGNRPGILVSGHDLRDLEELLQQTEGKGIDIYTHSEMLPAHYYPNLKKYAHLYGNYGGSWWHQAEEFTTFNGPILMTTNCIIPVRDAYRDRIFTTGMAGYPGVKHIPSRQKGQTKDFSEIIELAAKCPPPTEIENGTIVGGFAHNQVLALADKVVAAVKSGAIKRFVVMAGCDGRMKDRAYFTDVASSLPQDTVILTAGCAKYRYNKLKLGDIGGIPRVLDAGQCNDSYSLAVIALKLKEVFELEDINQLPISFDIAWYEQKAVAVLLALLSLGVKGIRLGPTLPAFLSPNVADVLIKTFNLKPTTDPQSDIAAMMAGQ